MAGVGYNPIHGYDTSGPPPPAFNPAQAQPAGAAMPQQYSAFFTAPPPPAVQQAPAAFTCWGELVLVQPSYQFPPLYSAAVNAGLPGFNVQGAAPPSSLSTPTAPAGYNYLLSSETCKFHVFKTPKPPWQTRVFKDDASTHVKLAVPTNVTVKELMQNLGCNNPDPKKNKIHEVAEIGGGRWSKGLTMCGDDKERMKKKITEFGWDKTRTGRPGERPVVWLWLSKG
ncbi:hypothetical protein F5884DRAFT_744183 [Xylogone sp. PMI_703]|nr:hypothetical protein F5884DRAFT_744183 [Xylogone sp. PMI_703]